MTAPTGAAGAAGPTRSVYHEGELAVQARAGVASSARRIGNGIRTTIPAAAQAFLRDRPLVVLGSAEPGGRVWASLLTGPPGFVRALDEQTVRVDARPAAADPLSVTLRGGAALGLLAIDFASRRRLRLNGTAAVGSPVPPDAGDTVPAFTIHARQVYANCPKYVQAREWTALPQAGRAAGGSSGPTAAADGALRGAALTPDLRRWIERADTCFVASAHPTGGADASHRGGNPGFVRVLDDRTLVVPDYSGNAMFNTLGNIHANPCAGLLFVDFEGGATLQLTGAARIVWDPARAAGFAGAERLIEFLLAEAVVIRGAHPLRGRLIGYSPFNPA